MIKSVTTLDETALLRDAERAAERARATAMALLLRDKIRLVVGGQAGAVPELHQLRGEEQP